MDRFEKTRRIKACHLAFIGGGEIGAGGLEPVHVLLQLGRLLACIEVVEVPLGQGAERVSTRGVGVENRTAIFHGDTFQLLLADLSRALPGGKDR